MSDSAILWRRLDQPGHESARVLFEHTHWRLAGSAVFLYESKPCRLDYSVVCDAEWRTEWAAVAGWVGDDKVGMDLTVDGAQRWRLNGTEYPEVAGCIDLDLNFSPSTNLLPIRRLALPVGESAKVRAAWLRFPGFVLEPLEQIYHHVDAGKYRYESAGGAFVTDLAVSADGFVTRYPGFWDTEGVVRTATAE
ncbi:MAG: putative glycolipid-binding domain-containing protein [Gemmatimonadaceae bacterium]